MSMAASDSSILLPVESCSDGIHCYEGYVNSESGMDYRVRITSPCDLKHARLECDWRLKSLLNGHEATMKQRLAESGSVHQFLLELKSLVRHLEARRSVTTPSQLGGEGSLLPCVGLVADLTSLGWDRVVNLSPDLTTFQLNFCDVAGRDHVLTVKLPPEYPRHAPTVTADTPLPFKPSWMCQSNNIMQLVDQFGKWLHKFQDLWAELDSVDQNCWVLEPENPNRACTYRRIGIGDRLSLHMVLDHAAPKYPPRVNFLGADQDVSEVMAKWAQSVRKWSSELSLYENLSRVLTHDLPMTPAENRQEDNKVECGICYAYRMDGHTPSVVCDNRQCCQSYHNQCLYDWLRILPTATKHFSKLTGKCPFCEHAISCSASTPGSTAT